MFFLFLWNTISKFQSCKHFIFNISLCNKSTYDVCECVFIFLLALVSQGASEKQNNIIFFVDVTDENVHGLFLWWKSLCYPSKYVQDQDGARMVRLSFTGICLYIVLVCYHKLPWMFVVICYLIWVVEMWYKILKITFI